jgi:hypothetical protein
MDGYKAKANFLSLFTECPIMLYYTAEIFIWCNLFWVLLEYNSQTGRKFAQQVAKNIIGDFYALHFSNFLLSYVISFTGKHLCELWVMRESNNKNGIKISDILHIRRLNWYEVSAQEEVEYAGERDQAFRNWIKKRRWKTYFG